MSRTVPWLVSTVSPSTTAENVTGVCAGSLDTTGSVAGGAADCDGDAAMPSEPPAADGGRTEALDPSEPACSPVRLVSGAHPPAANTNNVTAKHGMRALLILSTPV